MNNFSYLLNIVAVRQFSSLLHTPAIRLSINPELNEFMDFIGIGRYAGKSKYTIFAVVNNHSFEWRRYLCASSEYGFFHRNATSHTIVTSMVERTRNRMNGIPYNFNANTILLSNRERAIANIEIVAVVESIYSTNCSNFDLGIFGEILLQIG